MKLINPWLSLGIVSFLLVGCPDTPRHLKITEVAAHQVELFLDEPSTNVELGVDPLKLRWISQDPGGQPVVGEVSLAGAGPLHGRQFLVIFEDPNHTGPPVAQPFGTGTALGLKVTGGTFPNYTTGTSASMSVFGRSPRGLFFIRLTTDVVDDLVRFGRGPDHPCPVGSTRTAHSTATGQRVAASRSAGTFQAEARWIPTARRTGLAS